MKPAGLSNVDAAFSEKKRKRHMLSVIGKVGEVRDLWNTGTEETFKLLASWRPYFCYVVVNIVFMDNSVYC